MNTIINSGGTSKNYLFKDGILNSSITLGAGLSIRNNLIYTNNAGGTSWYLNYTIEANSTLFIKLTCTADSGSPGNEAYCSANVGQNGVVRFPGEGEQNVHLTLGILSNSGTTNPYLYLYTYGNGMAIEEMWIE